MCDDYDDCDDCMAYGDDYFLNDDGELESFCPYCPLRVDKDDW